MDTTKLTMCIDACNNVCSHHHLCKRRACARDLVCFNSHSFSWLKKRVNTYIYMLARRPVRACTVVLAHLYDDLSLLQTLEEEHVEPC